MRSRRDLSDAALRSTMAPRQSPSRCAGVMLCYGLTSARMSSKDNSNDDTNPKRRSSCHGFDSSPEKNSKYTRLSRSGRSLCHGLRWQPNAFGIKMCHGCLNMPPSVWQCAQTHVTREGVARGSADGRLVW